MDLPRVVASAGMDISWRQILASHMLSRNIQANAVNLHVPGQTFRPKRS